MPSSGTNCLACPIDTCQYRNFAGRLMLEMYCQLSFDCFIKWPILVEIYIYYIQGVWINNLHMRILVSIYITKWYK